ncbi:MAG: hypothetical protein ABI186_06400 [Candidatus Elarobacter sp.]
MIVPDAAAALAATPAAVVAKYQAALAGLKEPRVFVVVYTLEQTGARNLEQTHRIFRSGNDERDETIAVNGNRSRTPVIRIFRKRPYRYSVRALSPRPAAYTFTYDGPHKDGKHVDYVFRLTPRAPSSRFSFTQVTIDGITFLPNAVSFVTGQHGGSGNVYFVKSAAWWVARGASASANVRDGVAHERLSFITWSFPPSLPASTFAVARPLRTPPPALP